MTDAGATWPDVPPEVPPPWQPGQPNEPGRRDPAVPVPLVVPATNPTQENDWGLLERRIVLLLGPFDRDLATRGAAKVMTLDAERNAEIRLQMSGQDGDLPSALMLADTVDLARSPVSSLARGAVGGVVLAPFCAATRRLAAPNATFHMREPRMSLSGHPDELITGAEVIGQQLDQLRTWVARATGQSVQTVADDLQRGRMLTAQAALDYGLIDEIVTGHQDAS